jgi:GT2 family glycosyltransferase
MKISILVPVFNEEKNLPSLFKGLKLFAGEHEIILVDNNSEDGSLKLLQAFAAGKKQVRVLEERRRGFAEPLNKAVAEASGELLLFLDAGAVPSSGWVKAMANTEADLVVGETVSAPEKRVTAYGKLSAELFREHSRKAARAEGHSLPWGPACNLGVQKKWFEEVGPFSSEAAGAFDIDFCWRALLAGAQIRYAPKAVVSHRRRSEREALLRQFDRYGQSEAWLHRTWAFLLGAENASFDPLVAGVDAFLRLRHHSRAAKFKSLARPLDEVSAAFSAGVRLGFERAHRPCPLERPYPVRTVSWWVNPKEMVVYVPGRGATNLKGNALAVWRAHEEGASLAELGKLFVKLYRAPPEEAEEAAAEFIEELSPAIWEPT